MADAFTEEVRHAMAQVHLADRFVRTLHALGGTVTVNLADPRDPHGTHASLLVCLSLAADGLLHHERLGDSAGRFTLTEAGRALAEQRAAGVRPHGGRYDA